MRKGAGTVSNADGSSFSGHASLITGDLSIEAHARPLDPVHSGDFTGPVEGAAMLWDTLTFHGASSGAVGTVTMSGTAFSTPTDGLQNYVFGDLMASPVHFDIPFAGALMFFGLTNGFLPDSGPWSMSSSFDIVNDRPMMFFADLAIINGGDFKPADTLVFDPISLHLPLGVTFDSASGIFLQGNSVPEPSTWLFLASALAVLAVWRWKKGRITGLTK
jgi:hypothetical protein